MLSCEEECSKIDDDSEVPVSPKSPRLSPLIMKSDTSVFSHSPLSIFGSPKRAYFPTSPQEKLVLNEEEFDIIQSPRRRGEDDGDLIEAKNIDSVVDVATLSRTNSGLILVTLLSPTSNGESVKKSFVFEIQPPKHIDERCTEMDKSAFSELLSPKKSIDDRCIEINESFIVELQSPQKHADGERRNIKLDVKCVATIDEKLTGNYVYGVKFKVATKFYVATEPVEIGNYVLCEGDRGVDVGLVVSIHTKPQFRNKKSFDSIFRLASYLEYQALMQKLFDEQAALVHVQELADFFDLPLSIVNVEFQFDRQKMIIYYKTPKQRVDFRRLVTAIWVQYRSRVWMERDNSEKNVLMPASTSHMTSRTSERGIELH